jgi:hypothetical protein
MKSHKQLIPLFFIVFLIVIMLISSIFAGLPLVKADNNSQITTGVSLSGVDNNQGTYCYLAGYDVFATGNLVNFYNGNGSALVFSVSLGYYGSYNNLMKSRIYAYNSTCVLIIYIGFTTSASNHYSLSGILVHTDTKLSIGLFNTTNLGHEFNQVTTTDDLILVYTNNVYYALVSCFESASIGYSTDFYSISLVGNSLIHTDLTTVSYIGGKSFWFPSATALNELYIITNNGTSGYFKILKINCVTPSFSIIGVSNQDYNTFVYFINYNYNIIGINNYYDVLFAYPDSSYSTKMDIELIRFNDTYYQTPVNILVVDSNTVTNIMRPIGCILPSYVNNINSLQNGNYVVLYIGQLYRIFSANITVSGLTTISPSLVVQSNKPDGIVNAFMYFFEGLLWGFNSPLYFANGWWNSASIAIFSTSNNLGGILSPFGYGNLLEIDYQHNQISADYQITTNPSSGLGLFWVPAPYDAQKLFILPSTIGSFTLSQNVTYTVTGSLAFNGVISGNGNYTIYSNGENNNAPFANPSFNIPVGLGNGTINNGVFSFNVHFTNNMQIAPSYEVYMITTNLGVDNSTFFLAFTWQFIDSQGNTLPSGNNGLPSGSGTGGSGTGGSGTGGGGIYLQSLGISNTELAIGIYTICIIGLIIAFYYLHNNNIPFAVGLSLIVATIMCNIMNILGIYTYPIDALIIITIAVVLIYGRH